LFILAHATIHIIKKKYNRYKRIIFFKFVANLWQFLVILYIARVLNKNIKVIIKNEISKQL